MLPISQRLFLLLVMIAVGILVASSASLPPVVASKFSLGGAADGFMSRSAYVALTAVFMVFMTLLLPGTFRLVRYAPPSLISLPNRDYWLAPKRVEDTFEYLSSQGRWFGCTMLIFLCFVHLLVIEANRAQPPRLAERSLIIGSVLFLLVTLVWAVGLISHFSQTTTEQSI